KRMQFALGTALLVWAMNSFDSMWVRSGAAATHIRLGAELATENKADAAVSEFLAAVKAEPADGQATGLLAMALNQFHRPIDALETATWAVELSPRDPRTRLQLGAILAEQGQLDRAIAEGSLAVQLGPQYGFAYQSLATWLVIAGRDEQAVEAARQGLAVAPYNPVLHYALGLTLEDKGEFAAATDQLKDAVLLRPDWALAHLHLGTLLLRSANAIDGLKELKDAVRLAPDSPAVIDRVARILATASDAVLRNGPEAVRLAAHACALTGEKDPKLLGTLAAAYAETGRFSDAIRVAQQALALAQASGDAATALLCREMLEAFQSQHAYHPPPASPRQPGPSRDAQPAQ
ncbi:MAG: tetratricopeptide repeat protein, partial [Verrucomicrobiota bacterium]